MDSKTFNFITGTQKWGESQASGSSGGIVTYSFAVLNFEGQFQDFDSFIIEPAFRLDIDNAFKRWEEVADINFVLSADSVDVDIRLGWANIDGVGGVLGDATIPRDGPLERTIIRFDPEENWSNGGNATETETDFLYTATHEIGHTLGIEHSNFNDALMAEEYNSRLKNLQIDDIGAISSIYGASKVEKTDISRFFNPDVGGHFFTGSQAEAMIVSQNSTYQSEGVGFQALSEDAIDVDLSIPVHRFFNLSTGGHFFTASDTEKASVEQFDVFRYEGVGFRAYNIDTATTDPVYRFFNKQNGGHFFTVNPNEMQIVSEIPEFRYEGIGFFAYGDGL